MHKFKDRHGNEWKLKLTVPLMEEVRDETKIDIGKCNTLEALQLSVIDFVQVLCILCYGQMQQRGMTEQEFGEAFDGESIESALNAYTEEFLSFCPSHLREKYRRAVALEEKAAGSWETLVSHLLEPRATTKTSSNGATVAQGS